MTAFICSTCGTQYPESQEPPDKCTICSEERQYVGLQGQQWTSLEQLRRDRKNEFHPREPHLTAIITAPAFAIGQRAFLLESPGGNILWDCIALLDERTTQFIRARGGLAAIAISHPHYYSAMVEWAHRFECPVLLHRDDAEWIMRPDAAIELWEGETRELGGLTLLRLGGHFRGATVLHRPDGDGTLLSGDVVQVIPDREWVSFMYSYPNLIPLPASEVERMAAALEPYAFETIQGAWWETTVPRDGKNVVRRSAERYVRALNGELL